MNKLQKVERNSLNLQQTEKKLFNFYLKENTANFNDERLFLYRCNRYI